MAIASTDESDSQESTRRGFVSFHGTTSLSFTDLVVQLLEESDEVTTKNCEDDGDIVFIEEIDADDIEAAREQALERLEDMEHADDHEAYSAGWIDGVVMMDRVLTDPEYFGLQEDSDE